MCDSLMPKFKTFYEVQNSKSPEKSYSVPTHQVIKLPKSQVEQKYSYRDLQESIGICFSSAFRMQCFWESRNDAVQMFNFIPTRKRFSGKFAKWVRFSAVLWEYIFHNIDELMFVKWVVFFEQNCIAKWVIFVASFGWLWDLVGSHRDDDIHRLG